MFSRHLQAHLIDAIDAVPAVALLGPRQSGKNTLALEVAKTRPSIYLDLESERDRAKLSQAELYLSDHLEQLVILDEVHRASGLFPVLRGLIDQARRAGKRSGHYPLGHDVYAIPLMQLCEQMARPIDVQPILA